jgi:hypothetical protein
MATAEILIPGPQEIVAFVAHLLLDYRKFSCRKSDVPGDCHRFEPVLYSIFAAVDMDMRRSCPSLLKK